MAECLCSVGLDVGTTTTQLVVSQITVENRASAFAVPEMEITERQVVYRGQVHFTPLLDNSRVNGDAIRELVLRDYAKAGIRREDVDTGAIIITGETSRKENARTVLDALSGFAGEFVVATAGPDLESVLAAKGAGAVAYSERTGKTVLHMDIGGGTSNLALIREGKIERTGCFNIGGRLIKLDAHGRLIYVSPVLEGLFAPKVGDIPTQAQLTALAHSLTHGLEMAAGLREKTQLLDKLTTQEAASGFAPVTEPVTVSFSGGVADCIETQHPPLAFGDMGPLLGQAIRESRLCQNDYVLGTETIRATVIGAGSHTAQLSGSTVFYRGVTLPVKNLPVAAFSKEDDLKMQIPQKLREKDQDTVVLALPGYTSPSYEQVTQLAEVIAQATAGKPVFVCLEADMAKALGHSLCLHLPENTPCLCIDRVRLTEDSFLDIGTPVGPCLPVVVKTLVLSK